MHYSRLAAAFSVFFPVSCLTEHFSRENQHSSHPVPVLLHPSSSTAVSLTSRFLCCCAPCSPMLSAYSAGKTEDGHKQTIPFTLRLSPLCSHAVLSSAVRRHASAISLHFYLSQAKERRHARTLARLRSRSVMFCIFIPSWCFICGALGLFEGDFN